MAVMGSLVFGRRFFLNDGSLLRDLAKCIAWLCKNNLTNSVDIVAMCLNYFLFPMSQFR